MSLENILSMSFHNHFSLKLRRPNLYQLFVPLYHEDGDMMEIFIKEHAENSYEICDCGMTLMRLSYTYDINTSNKKSVMLSILKENGANINDGNIYIIATANNLFNTIMQFSQVVAKISNMNILQRGFIESMFYDLIREYVSTSLKAYNPIRDAIPIKGRSELTVDYMFQLKKEQKPIFLFPVRGFDRVKTATISLLSFQKEKFPFTGVVVHENYETLPPKERKLIMSAADKQFFDYEDFEQNSSSFFERTLLQ